MEKDQDKVSVKFDLIKFCKLCLRRWLWFVVAIGFCVGLACVSIYRKVPKSEVMASLKLPPETTSGGITAISDLASSFSLGDMFGGSSTDNEVAMLSSHSVCMKTVKDLGLNVACYQKLGPMKWQEIYGKGIPFMLTPPSVEANDTITRAILFNISVNDEGTFDISAKIKRKTVFDKKALTMPCEVTTPYGSFGFDTVAAFATRNPKIKAYRMTFGNYNGAAQGLARRVRAYAPDKKTDFIAISFITSDPQYGELLLRTIIDNYNLVCNEQRNDQNYNTLAFVDKRLATLEDELAQTEERMETFKKANNLTDVEVDAATLLQTSGEIERAQLLARVECEALSMAREFVSNQENKYSLIPSLGSGESSTAPAASIETYNELIIQRMRLMDSTTPNNTALKRLDAQIDAMRLSVIESLDRSYDQAKIKLDELTRKTSSMNSRLGELPTLEREYIGIERDLMLQQQLYLFLLKQREEASMSLSQATPSLITVDEPYTLTESLGMSLKMTLAFALLMGGLIPMALIYFFDYKKAPLTASDIAAMAQAPVIGKLKKDANAKGADLMDADLPVLHGGESVRQLRAEVVRIIGGLPADAPRTVMVASPRDGEGKTYLASNLAASLALLGKKTLLVEADMTMGDKPLLGCDLQHGMADLATMDAASCVRDLDLGSGAILSLLGPGHLNGRNADDIAGHDRVKAQIANLASQYEYTIIDTPSYDSHSTAFEMAELASLTLCPVAAGISTPASIEQADALCADGRLPRVAIVVNFA